MDKLDILKAASARFTKNHPNLKLLILFGSRARGDADPSSDWDFAFLYDSTFSKPEKSFWFPGSDILDTLSTLLNLPDNDIDLVDLSHCSEMLAHFISRDGQLIYEKNPGEFANFQQQSLKTPAELKQFRQDQRENVLQTLQRWGV
jgi:uncharacterized protein